MINLTLISALSENYVIGKDNSLPWKLPDDMKFFMKTTTGHPIIMGRKSFQSLGSKPLKNRKNIVLTSKGDFSAEGVETAKDIDQAIVLAKKNTNSTIFIIGGGEIYQQFLPFATHMILTHVHAVVEGDAYFPSFNPEEWVVTKQELHPADERHAYAFTFTWYERKILPFR